MDNKVYCIIEYTYLNNEFIKDKWYQIYLENEDFIALKGEVAGIVGLTIFYKNYKNELLEPLFNKYFYTEQEYNRTTNLDRLLNG